MGNSSCASSLNQGGCEQSPFSGGYWFRVDNGAVEALAKIGGSAAVVYLYITRHANPRLTARDLAIKRIAKALEFSEKTVRRAIDDLEAAELMQVNRPRGGMASYTVVRAVKSDHTPQNSEDNSDRSPGQICPELRTNLTAHIQEREIQERAAAEAEAGVGPPQPPQEAKPNPTCEPAPIHRHKLFSRLAKSESKTCTVTP